MEKESSIKDIINSSLDQIKTIIDANTVLGNQIVTPSGTVIIPVSKVSMGFASGGLDVPTSKSTKKNFGAGGGTGVTVTPVGFLVVSPTGNVEMMPMTAEKAGPLEQITDILERTPDIINRIKSVIGSEKSEQSEKDASSKEAEYAEKLRNKNA
ncbi:MAG: sporulation protein YtfJ [Ruminococcaceae bacterium]|nr:sporulation protein YtfJ [Oscillospiraceae bacterium]